MDPRLTPEEQFAFAALVRWLVRLDGSFTEEEEAAIEDLSSEIFAGAEGSPYRSVAEEEKDADPSALWKLIERAGEEVGNEEELRRIAHGVTRPAAREILYQALYAVAASDVIVKAEWPFFEWLSKEWPEAAATRKR